MSLTPAFLDELRARTLLSGLIAKTVKLQRAGREFRACCPFHNEKTPSFYVNDDKGFYHCFGCSAHGDAIRWMTEQQGLPFIDAVKELAQAAGLEMPEQDRQSAQKAERAKGLHDVMQAASDWFETQLGGIDGADARALLKRRGISDATRRAFSFGFAPDSRGKLRTALRDFGDAMLIEAGLLIDVEGKEPYDRFRGRLMIPIRDARGRVIAFGGRIIGEGEPKYLNSPETPLFDKGRTLYNLDRAQAAVRKTGRVIAVEGYMDVIALAQAGFEEAVAPLGTAMTEHQLERLWRMTEVPLLCFDGDSAGQKAALRAAHRALPLLQPGRSLAFVPLGDGLDPDDLVRTKGAAAFEAMLAKPQQLSDLLWQSEVAAEPLSTPEQRAGLKQRLTALADIIVEPSVKSEYKAEFRERLDKHFDRGPREFQPRQRQAGGARPSRGSRNARGVWQPPEAPPSAKARTLGTDGLDPALAKAVLAGLIRHPVEIARHMEVLGSLRVASGALGKLFEAVIDVALEDRQLDQGKVLTILAGSGFDQVASELLRADTLPFSFCRDNPVDEARAREDLNEAIAVLVSTPVIERAVGAAMAAVTAAQYEADDVEYAALVERHDRLAQERKALGDRLANLRLADEEDFDE
ncbi:DNA primase [Sphingomonas sp. S2-65]|uniref:DNA primase n=1 Tax=Sphingomonas sp. S2-65 TaxID=2903960 RepID=UPI001F492485|nr:DNA primase [Sphingomonas sp. S2-65]UYY58907.1 DNA primase [Sphingomonas sp. S2-65]